MKDRRQRTLEAYRDGRLSPRKRARVREWLIEDEDSRLHLERTDALGGMIREAWSEGPSAPSAERLMAAIRPAMREIDRERRARSPWVTLRVRLAGFWPLGARSLDGVEEAPGAGPGIWGTGIWEWATGGAVAAASVSVALLWGGSSTEVRYEAQHLVAMPSASGPAYLSDVAWPTSVYDLVEGDKPLVVYEGDGATVIYVGEEDAPSPEDLSLRQRIEDWA